MSADTYDAVLDAIRAHVADECGDNLYVTDWYTVVACADAFSDDATSYVHISANAPRHTQIGLLSVASQRLLEGDDDDDD